MFLLEPEQTAFDLRFRMFGTDVRVHPLFWLVCAFLGWPWQERAGFPYLAMWVVCVFASILLHEFGHVFAGRLFGADGYIVLYSLGGLAVGSSGQSRRWQRVIVSLAGPAAQLVLYGLLWWVVIPHLLPRLGKDNIPKGALVALIQLLEINWFWPLLNLLPIWPLDGGKVSREFFTWLMGGRGVRASLGLSIITAGFIAVNSLAARSGRPLVDWEYLPTGGLYTIVFFGLLALNNFQELQQVRGSTRHLDEPSDAWERDPDYWKR